MLVLAYLGQGAQLIVNGDVVITSVFYQSIPGTTGSPLYWIMCKFSISTALLNLCSNKATPHVVPSDIFAVLATLIAAQAMISACFSLLHQVGHFVHYFLFCSIELSFDHTAAHRYEVFPGFTHHEYL